MFNIQYNLFKYTIKNYNKIRKLVPGLANYTYYKDSDNLKEVTSKRFTNIVLTNGQIVEVQLYILPLKDIVKQAIYLKIKISTNPGDPGTEVYFDTGSNPNLADKGQIVKWAKNLRWTDVIPYFVKGVGARSKIKQ